MITGLSLLIFSRDDTEFAKDLIYDLNEFVSEIVIIDSSLDYEHQNLKSWAEKLTGVNIRVYFVPPLGYPDMMRPYGISKCSNDWILLMDVDERAGPEFKKNLHTIIDSNVSDVYSIYRYSAANPNAKISGVGTQQIRLFKNGFLDEKGILHRLPKSKGRYAVLPEKYYITHMMHDNSFRWKEYGVLDKLSRITYADLPDRFLRFVRLIMAINK